MKVEVEVMKMIMRILKRIKMQIKLNKDMNYLRDSKNHYNIEIK
jgi:hypothetical protein